MSWVAAAVVGSAVVGGAVASRNAKKAANAQTESAEMGVAENRRQFDAVQRLLQPYVTGGKNGLLQYQQLAGMQGSTPQQKAITQLQRGSEFTSLARQGEDAILANASATGGLRGGNVQSGLAEFRSNLLSSLIERQLGRYGGMAQMGQNSAAGVGSAALSTGQANAGLMQQAGAAQAGGIVAGSNAITGALGQVGGFFAGRGQPAVPAPTAASAIGGGGGFGSGVVYGNQDMGQYF